MMNGLLSFSPCTSRGDGAAKYPTIATSEDFGLIPFPSMYGMYLENRDECAPSVREELNEIFNNHRASWSKS